MFLIFFKVQKFAEGRVYHTNHQIDKQQTQENFSKGRINSIRLQTAKTNL